MYDRKLKTFICVADRGSLSKAAEDLYVTPASIMKQMNSLEYQLGMKLLIRTNQGVELTEAGKYIYHAAQKIMAESEDIIFKAKAIAQQNMKTIRVGSSFLNPSKVLTDLWDRISPDSMEYRIKIVPYQDNHEQIMAVIASLGTSIDFLVGSFNSEQMLRAADYYILGYYHLCVAVPRNHRLAAKKKLTYGDLYGEHLIMVKKGDTMQLDDFRDKLKMTHPQIIQEDAHYFYDLETFNSCEATGSLLLTLDAWVDIHPSLITLPVDWDFKISYGLLFSRSISKNAADFLEIIRESVNMI